MPRDLKGKVAFVTGSARSLGQAYAQRLAQDGATLVLVDIHHSPETARLVEAAGGKVIDVVADISDETSVTACRDRVFEELGRVDILINNAGIYPFNPFEKITFAERRRVMAINLDSLCLTAQAFLTGMRERKWGPIVNVSSNTAWRLAPNFTHYITSKLGVVGFTRALASEVGQDGVTVNAVAPSLTDTPGTEDSPARQIFATWQEGQAIRRLQQPADMVGAVSFLCSDDAAFITAQTIMVDGGMVRL